MAAPVAVVAALTASFAITLTAPTQPSPAEGLVAFLEAHHLDHGIGDYWSSSITTVTSDGAVTVRPVVTDPRGRVVRYERQSTAAWYTGQRFEFLVIGTAAPPNVSVATAAATFGPPARQYTVGSYQVLVWSHPLTVSADGWDPNSTSKGPPR